MSIEILDPKVPGKKPLTRGDLMSLHTPTTPPDSPDTNDLVEKYQEQLNEILETPLKPENFSTYAQDALDKVIGLVEHMTSNYPGEYLPLPRGTAESFAAKSYGLDIDVILDMLQEKVNETHQIQDFVENLSDDPEVFLPPQQNTVKINPGSAELPFKETAPKLETILFLLQNRYGIEINDPSQITITKGSITKEMMRKEPYFLIDIPSLGRKILVCNEVGNITYVMDSQKLEEIHIDSEVLVDLEKSEIDIIIERNPGIGVRIVHSSKYIPKIEQALEDIQIFEERGEAEIDKDPSISEESLLLDTKTAIEGGYKNASQIAKDLKITPTFLFEFIKKMSDELGEIKIVQFTTKKAKAYSPEQIEMIVNKLYEEGKLGNEAPDEYMSIQGISDMYGIAHTTVSRLVKILGDNLGEVRVMRFHNKPAQAFSPEQVKMIVDLAESEGYFEKIPEGYTSLRKLSKEIDISVKFLNKIIKELGEQLGKIETFRVAGSKDMIFLSRPQRELLVSTALQRKKELEPPVGYKNKTQIATELGISDITVKKITIELANQLGEVKKYQFKNVYTEGYSPSQIDLIKARAIAKGIIK